MPRPVKTDSKDPRYWYFRLRYLAKKRGEKIKYGVKPSAAEKDEAQFAMSEANWARAKRRPSSVTWNELSRGSSNS